MKKIKVGDPITFEGKEYQFYANETPLSLPSLRQAFFEEQLQLARAAKSSEGELTAMANHINYNVYTPQIEEIEKRYREGKHSKQDVAVLMQSLIEARKVGVMMSYKDTVAIRLEPSVTALCYLLYLEDEDEQVGNMDIKKRILYSNMEVLGFFLNFLYRQLIKLDDFPDNLGSFLIQQHQSVILSKDWTSLMASMGIPLQRVGKEQN